MSSLGAASWLRAADAPKRRIRVVYALHAEKQPGPDWPNVGFDFRPVMERINEVLAKACPEFEFVHSLASGPEPAKKILGEDQTAGIDGYVVYQMNCWNQVVQTLAGSGKPVLYADFQFAGSGGFLVYTAGFLRQKAANVGFVASSRIEDLVAAVKCFSTVLDAENPKLFAEATAIVRRSRTPAPERAGCIEDPLAFITPEECTTMLKGSRILAFRGQEAGAAGSVLGIPVMDVPFAELNDAWKAADPDESRAVADRWVAGASVVAGVSRETLVQSAAMYLAQKAMLKKHEAAAITINCLGGFYGGHIHAYPCLGFHELSNEGLVGACECDVRSTAAMLLLTTLTKGRPGYISDPVMDTSKRQIIYAHCVASNRAFGPRGKANPYEILTHSEDRQGASVRSLLPTGYLTTTIEVAEERKEILFHQARAVENDPDDRACRTKLCAEPLGDFEKLFRAWDQWGWHRVTCYGDLKAPIYAVADALGWKVVAEA